MHQVYKTSVSRKALKKRFIEDEDVEEQVKCPPRQDKDSDDEDEEEKKIRRSDPPGHVPWTSPDEMWASREADKAAQGTSGAKRVVSLSRGPDISATNRDVEPGTIDTEEEIQRLREQEQRELDRLRRMMDSAVVVAPAVATNRDVELGDEEVAQVAPGTSGHKKGVVADATGHSRLTAWWVQFIFSAIALGAHLSALYGRYGDDLKNSTKDEKWTASVMIISTSFAFLALLAYHLRVDQFAGKLSEGGFVLIVLALWSAGIPAVMDPENSQAVEGKGQIVNANLYFSSWACLAIALWTFGSYVTQVHLKEDFFAVDASTPLGQWFMLAAASVVVMSSSSQLLQVVCEDDILDCKRIKFAISTGAVGTIFAVVACLLGFCGLLKTYPEVGLVVVIFCMYTCAVAFVTFGGAYNGNLYFSTWIGFALSAWLLSKSVQKVRKGNVGEAATGHSRLTAWWFQLIFSAIALAAHLSALYGRYGDDLKNSTKDEKWTASVMIISTSFAFLALLAYHLRVDQFAGKLSEGGFVLIVLALWSAGMPAIMDPENSQAIDDFGNIVNGNLYFSSWACLTIAVWTFGSYVTQVHLKEDFFTVDASTPLGQWFMLAPASVVVMSSSSRLLQVVCEDYILGDSLCKRDKFAISTGAVGTAFALVACLLGSRGLLKTCPEVGLVVVVFCMYTCAIAFVTFGGDKGAPGYYIGNLYFSTWIGFALSACLLSKFVQKVRKGNAGEAEAEACDQKVEEAQQAPPEAPLEVSEEEYRG